MYNGTVSPLSSPHTHIFTYFVQEYPPKKYISYSRQQWKVVVYAFVSRTVQIEDGCRFCKSLLPYSLELSILLRTEKNLSTVAASSST